MTRGLQAVFQKQCVKAQGSSILVALLGGVQRVSVGGAGTYSDDATG